MRNLKIIPAIIIIVFSTVICKAQRKLKTSIGDLETLSGSWNGSLTYLDYSSGKPYTMPANLVIKQMGKSAKYSFSNIYPNEPSANFTDTVALSSDGKLFDGKLITSRQKTTNGDVEFITEDLGKDGNENKPAKIRLTYTFNQNSFSKRKDIQFVGETGWIKRHEYLYMRNLSK